MLGFDPHHLTTRERVIVFTVVVLVLVGLTIWIGTVIYMLPDPSQGTFVPPQSPQGPQGLIDGIRLFL